MSWIEYHTALRDHWKIKRLAEALGVEYVTALGAISCLWLWCAEYSPTGFLGRFTDDEIRFGARLTDKKFTFFLLASCGLVTKNKYINDWGKHGIKLLVSKRKANREYAKRKRNNGYPLDTHSVAIPTVPNQPYRTVSLKTTEQAPAPVDKPVDNPKDNPEVKEALERISKTGFKIYAMLYKAKANMKQPKGWRFPDQVILRVCAAYHKEQATIKEPWGWFVAVLRRESEAYFAAQNIAQHQEIKKQSGMSLAEIFNTAEKDKND